MSIPNTIERQIHIAAPVERVWSLVSEPGWWINQGEIRAHTLEERDGSVLVHDEDHGVHPIEVVELREPEYAAFRWLAVEGSAHAAEHIPTIVEFTLQPTGDGVLVRVVETGFADNGDVTDEVRISRHSDNTQGWEVELVAARAHLETE